MARTLLGLTAMMFQILEERWSRRWCIGILLSVWTCNLLGATRVVNSPTALAIDGRGWFLVADQEKGEVFFTRQGDFVLDENGYLETLQGFAVQGIDSSRGTESGNLLVDSSGAPAASDPLATVASFRIEPSGEVIVRLSDGSEFVRGRVLLQDFRMPANLLRVEPGIYKSVPGAEPVGGLRAPGSNGLGVLRTGIVETEELRWTVKGAFRRDDPGSHGALTATGLPTDFGIRGDGFFVVRDPATAEHFLTRVGFFLLDGDGFLKTYSGLRVQGFIDSSETVIGDIVLDAVGAPDTSDSTSPLAGFEVWRDGRVWVWRWDGTRFSRARILLHQVDSLECLHPAGNGLYSGVSCGGLGTQEKIGSSVGLIYQGSVELSQVTRDLLNARRNFEFFPQGALRRTDGVTNLAISGRGFFVVRNPFAVEELVTRRGRFRIDRDQFLVTAQGERVQGFVDPGFTEIGDLKIDDCFKPFTSDPSSTMVGFRIDTEGVVDIELSDGTSYSRAQVLLRDFAQTYSLQAIGGARYRATIESRPSETMLPPGTRGVGKVYSGAIEEVARPQRLMLPPAAGIQLLITGEPGTSCAVQARMRNRWVTIGRLKLGATGEADFFDTSNLRRFHPGYRVIAE